MPAGEYAVQATVAARSAQDAAATLAAVSGRETAQAREMTRAAEVATAQAAAIATATAQAYAIAHASTADALAFRATAQAQALEGTRAASAVLATGTAQAQTAHFEATLAADEAQRLALQRQREALANDGRRIWNALWPALLAAAAVMALAAAGAILADWWRHRQPVREVAAGSGHVLVTGDYHLLPPPRITVTRPEPAQLPAPPAGDEPPPLPRFERGHVLVAGETGSGKSNAMRAVLQRRQQVVVLDPHATPNAWPAAEVIGGGRDFAAIEDYMRQMAAQLDERYRLAQAGRDDFEALTVAVDEMPAIVAATGRDVADVWRQWLREGRKVGLYLVAATQSIRVRTLGIEGEGDLLENFQAVLVLGKLAEARHPELARGSFPAVLETLGGARAVRVPLIAPPAAAAANQARVVAPAVEPLTTRHGVITPTQIADVLRLKRAGWPSSRIETTVFEQETPGGAAYYKVRAVLDAYGAADPE